MKTTKLSMNNEDNEVIHEQWRQQSYLMDSEDNEVTKLSHEWSQKSYLIDNEDHEVIL